MAIHATYRQAGPDADFQVQYRCERIPQNPQAVSHEHPDHPAVVITHWRCPDSAVARAPGPGWLRVLAAVAAPRGVTAAKVAASHHPGHTPSTRRSRLRPASILGTDMAPYPSTTPD